MTTNDRAARSAAFKAAHDALTRQLAATARPGSLSEVQAAARGTNLAYLFHHLPTSYTTTKPVQVEVYVDGFTHYFDLPAGSQGWVWRSQEVVWSAYRRVGDMDVPAEGAVVVRTTTYFTLGCVVEHNGRLYFASALSVVRAQL